MLIELRKGMTLHPCTFNAVIAPEKVMISALNNNMDLQRFVFLYVSGKPSLFSCRIRLLNVFRNISIFSFVSRSMTSGSSALKDSVVCMRATTSSRTGAEVT